MRLTRSRQSITWFEDNSAARAKRAVAAIVRIFDVATLGGTVIQEALQLSLPDFEDSVTAAAAQLAGCDFIVTRDPKGFRGSPARPLTPEAVMSILFNK
jgi:hypothetical protein